MLDQFDAQTFEPYLDETFAILFDDPAQLPGVLRLVEVTELGEVGSTSGTLKRRPFSLIFQEANSAVRPQQIYHLAHPEVGDFDIFLVPIASDSRGTHYQAIFS